MSEKREQPTVKQMNERFKIDATPKRSAAPSSQPPTSQTPSVASSSSRGRGSGPARPLG